MKQLVVYLTDESATSTTYLYSAIAPGIPASASPRGNISGYVQHFEQVFSKNPKLILPKEAQEINKNTLRLEFAEPITGKIYIRDDDYYHQQTKASDTWIINHNLNIFGAIVHCYDHEGKWIFPEEIQLVTQNQTICTFEEPVSGTAVFVIFRSEIDQGEATNLFGDPNTGTKGFWKAGEGGDDPYFSPDKENNINIILTSGGLSSFTETSTAASGSILINFEVPKTNAYTINEFGIFDSNRNLHYYTRCSDIYKPENVELHMKYRIRKE